MKKFFCLLLALLIPTMAFASTIDLSGLSFDELVALKEQINLAIWKCQEWQEVEVPQGVWIGGEDIPVGRWTVRCASNWGNVTYGDKLEANGRDIAYTDARGYFYIRSKDTDIPEYAEETYLDVSEGMYISISMAPMLFSTYSGKPDLGFK